MTAGYHTLRELQEQAVLQNREVWEIVRNADMSENERSAEASFEKMTIMYQAMKQAVMAQNCSSIMHREKISAGTLSEKSWRKRLKWVSQMPVCGGSWQLRQQDPAVYFRQFY